MISGLFIYRVYHLSKANHVTYCGVAFPITSNGDFLTCYHVMNQEIKEGDKMVIHDNQAQIYQQIDPQKVIHSKELDLSILINPLKRKKDEYIPILDTSKLLVGEDVNTFGYYKNAWNKGQLDAGYFKGHIVNFAPNSLASNSMCLTVSFPFIEGISGSPLMTYHSGLKLVGLNLGNNQHRIQQSIVTSYQDDQKQFQETTSRIVEFGISLHPHHIIQFLNEKNIKGFLVTDSHVEINGLD